MKHEELGELLRVLAEGGWKRAAISTDEFTLTLGEADTPAEAASSAPAPAPAVATARRTASAQPTSNPVEPAPAPAPAPVEGSVITAPSVGLAWRSPKPGAAPFVEVGQRVEVGETVMLLEVMKLFTPITSEVTGTVVSIEVDDGQTVEFGTPILVVAPE